MVLDITVVYTDNNLKFEVRRHYDGRVLHKSNKFKTYANAKRKLELLIEANDWRVETTVHQ